MKEKLVKGEASLILISKSLRGKQECSKAPRISGRLQQLESYPAKRKELCEYAKLSLGPLEVLISCSKIMLT
jgi:hypothetical protein